MPRTAKIERNTAETQIVLSLNLDGTGTAKINTGVWFLDHMLTLTARHGLFDLEVEAAGDLDVDLHHTVEDTGICLGQAIVKALGDKAGIVRYGTPLQAHNGRDALVDAYQEALDLAVYLRQAIYERDNPQNQD